MDRRGERPTCWLCADEMTVSYWRAVPARTATIYRACCLSCLCDTPGLCAGPKCSCVALLRAPVVACEVCGIARVAYTEPVPLGRATWRSRVAVCSFACLNAADPLAWQPPAPRPCQWCGEAFQPARRSDARLCSNRCRLALRRSRTITTPEDAEEYAARVIGSAPRLTDVVAKAFERMASEEGL